MEFKGDSALRILVVDDEEQLRQFICRALQKAGYTNVACARDGQEGLELCSKSKFDVVICDIVMPEIDGLEMIFTLRRNQPDLRVIAMSGGGRVDAKSYLNLAEKAGAAVVEKPFKPETLFALIENFRPR